MEVIKQKLITMEKEQSLSNVNYLGFIIILFTFFSCKQESRFLYDKENLTTDPISASIKKKKVKEIEIYKLDSLNNIDSLSLRKFYLNPDGQVYLFEDKPPFSISLKVNYESNFPTSMYCLSDYALEYTSSRKIDSVNKKIIIYWKDEFKNIEDSTIYLFNLSNQVIKVKNDLDFFNFFFRKKIGNGIFKINFDTELSYTKDSLIREKRTLYILKNPEFKGIIPDSSFQKFTYNSKKELLKSEERYFFQNSESNTFKEVFYKDGLPTYHLINGNKFIYQYKF